MVAKLKSMFGMQDMTVGNPMRTIMFFTIPMLLGNVLQLVYNMTDSIVVGQFAGPDQLAAVGVAMPITMMFSVFFMTVGTGVSVMVSQYFGARDKDNLSKTVGSSLLLILIATVIASILGILLTDVILTATKCPPEIFEYAKSYLIIILIGFVGVGFYNILGGILRGLGDSTFPLITLIGTALLNVFLDVWMVAKPEQLWGIGLGMGVAGAAWATIIAQFLSAAACLWRLTRMKEVATINRHTIRMTKDIVMQIVRIGLPSGFQQLIMSASFVLIQRLTNAIQIEFPVGSGLFDGAIFVAVNTAVMSIDQFAMMPAQTFNMTASTFTGQNIGAGKIDRISQGFKIILISALTLAVIVAVIIYFFGAQLMGLFITDPGNPERAARIIEVGVQMSRIILWCYLLMAIANTVGGIMRGAGDTMSQLLIMISTNIIIRIPLTWLWINASKTDAVTGGFPGGDPKVLYWSMIIAFGLNVTVSCIYFATGRWKTKSIIKPPKPDSMLD